MLQTRSACFRESEETLLFRCIRLGIKEIRARWGFQRLVLSMRNDDLQQVVQDCLRYQQDRWSDVERMVEIVEMIVENG